MEEVISGKRTIGEVTSETLALYGHLKTLPIGAVVTYDDLTAIVGRNVQESARSALQTARRMCQRDHQIVFSPVVGYGLKRLNDNQIVSSADGDIKRIHRSAGRGIKKLACVDYQNLDHAGMSSLNAKAAVLGTLAQHSTATSVQLLERHYANESKPMLPQVAA